MRAVETTTLGSSNRSSINNINKTTEQYDDGDGGSDDDGNKDGNGKSKTDCTIIVQNDIAYLSLWGASSFGKGSSDGIGGVVE